MPTTSDYLEQLQQDREDLVDNLESKGITGLTGDETFTELVPEVLNIPSGSGGLDWSAIGYSSTPQSIIDGYNYAKQIYDNWDETQTLDNKFKDDLNLKYMPLVDITKKTSINSMFDGAKNMEALANLDYSNANTCSRLFANCSALKKIENFNITANIDRVFFTCQNIESISGNIKALNSMAYAFYSCSNLKDIPIIDLSSTTIYGVGALQSAFSGCKSLTDQSLDNILQMCISATSYLGTKTLVQLGFASTNYQASRIQALPHYQDFIEAGWTIGYS